MIWFILFVFLAWLALLVVGPSVVDLYHRRMNKIRRLQHQNDLFQYWSEADEQTMKGIWRWLQNANGRRKRVERYLRKQKAKNVDLRKKLFKVGWELGTALIENDQLRTENESLTKMHRVLAAEVAAHILTVQDRQEVTKGLTRKL